MSSQKARNLSAFWKLISRLERQRKSRIYCLIHGHDDHGHFCGGPTFAAVLSERDRLGDIDTLEILLHSPGGDADVAYQIVRCFRRHCKKLNVLVPLYAKSAATLMCLGADAIFMGELAELGPIDVQITDPVEKGNKQISPLDEFKSAEFLRDYSVEILDIFTLLILRRSGMSVKESLHEALHFTAEITRPLYEQLDPLEIGEYKRSLAIGEEYGNRLLAMTKNPYRRSIIEALVSKYPSHGFVIDRNEARSMGLPVHPLNKSQEGLLIPAISSILESGESLYGFHQLQPKSATKPVKAAKPAKPVGKPPTSKQPAAKPTVVAAAG